MDARFEVVQAKTRKLCGKQHVTQSRALCDLPDVVLYHILSFLPMKVVVRTCVLAMRWRYLWASLPNFEFRQTDFPERSLFMNFVERAFIFRDRSTINALKLSCDVLSDAPRINAWITAASRGDLLELSLKLKEPKEPFSLPCCIFDSRILNKFELVTSGMVSRPPAIILRCPSSARLSCLKVLILRGVTFVGYSFVDKLFSCPLLEELYIKRCRWKILKTITIAAPNLLKLSIDDYDDDKGQEISSHDRVIQIHGARLMFLHYTGSLMNRYDIHGSLTQLVEATISGWHDNRENIDLVAKNLLKLLEFVSSAPSLVVNSWVFEVLERNPELYEALPLFTKLTKLRVNEIDPPESVGGLFPLLRRCPNIATLEFDEHFDGLFDPEDFLEVEDVPQCFHTLLKRIKIDKFYTESSVFSRLKALLKAATVLEEMVIIFNVRYIDSESLSKKLMLFPRGLNCRITLLPTK